ncbi:DoxX family membrane protein [Flavobacteriaceae bacterium R38]|nr:DoxX family membrane protein [Flavobacteriaceae bacterium R38]
MKIIVGISRVFVGILFIISGFIKLNDPLGFSFKLEEYFSPSVLNLGFLEPYALALAIFVVIFEVVLGVMLLVGFKTKFTVWSLLLMIVFFTFLTFYSAYFNKVTDCGCFGDAIKLTPWESFTKDVILLVLILILFFGRKYIKPLISKRFTIYSCIIVLIACIVFVNHVLNHLPSIDFRAYKIGSNIREGMTIPEDAPQAIYEYAWKFKIDGKEKVIKTTGDYPTVDGEYVDVKTKLIQEGYEPPVHDFTIEKNGEDFTEAMLAEEHLIAVIAYDLAKSDKEAFKKIKSVTDKALKNGYKVLGLSASNKNEVNPLKQKYNLNFDFYFTDQTTLKTIVRSNPGFLELDKGTILQKLHYNDADDLKLVEQANANLNLNLDLKRQLDSILRLDQGIRYVYYAKTKEEKDSVANIYGIPVQENESDYFKLWRSIDSTNLIFGEKIIKEYGYPGKALVGEPTNTAIWYVIQHAPDKIPEYLDLMKEAGKKGDLPFTNIALMEDRYLMGKKEEQIYGSQGVTYTVDGKPISFIWPIKDHENVNAKRKEAGFTEDVEEYSKRLDIEYKPVTLKEALEIIEKSKQN